MSACNAAVPSSLKFNGIVDWVTQAWASRLPCSKFSLDILELAASKILRHTYTSKAPSFQNCRRDELSILTYLLMGANLSFFPMLVVNNCRPERKLHSPPGQVR